MPLAEPFGDFPPDPFQQALVRGEPILLLVQNGEEGLTLELLRKATIGGRIDGGPGDVDS